MGIRNANESLKVNIMVEAEFMRQTGYDDEKEIPIFEYAKFYFNTKVFINSESDIQPIIDKFSKNITEPDRFKRDIGSDWFFNRYMGFRIAISRYVVRMARGYIELPEKYRSPKKGLINIHNDDDKCFQYCIIAALHPPKNKITCIDCYNPRKFKKI
jgi:hypothetical protein